MSAYRFQRERVMDTIDEALPLLDRHWEEIAWTKDLSGVDIDRGLYQVLEERGNLVLVTARTLAGDLVGYAVYFVKMHPHYRSVKWAVSDIYWVAPEHRGRALGLKLFQRIEEELQADGVRVMHTTGKTAHPAPKRILDALGHTEIEWGMGKLLWA